jgi:hypothetical protein
MQLYMQLQKANGSVTAASEAPHFNRGHLRLVPPTCLNPLGYKSSAGHLVAGRPQQSPQQRDSYMQG